MGYYRAGFDVVGVDIAPQPRYPFEFIEDDALGVLDDLIDGCYLLPPSLRGGPWGRCLHANDLAAVHASPPCQHWSVMSNCRPGLKDTYPALIEPTRDRLAELGLPFVIENVPRAPLIDPVMLCGTSFGLGSHGLEIRRHRLFEPHGFNIPSLLCDHRGYVMNRNNTAGRQRMKDAGITKRLDIYWAQAMGIDWMTNMNDIEESIPPAFTEYIGKFLLDVVGSWRELAA